jgi:sec-independent protein translocase protein TatA/sec-independent protein translocase protein TatB
MFGLGMSEIVLIAVIALLVIGPKKLPEVAKALGKGFGEFKKAMNEFKDAVNIDIDEDEKTSEKDDLSATYKEKWEKDIKNSQPLEKVDFSEKSEENNKEISENGNKA